MNMMFVFRAVLLIIVIIALAQPQASSQANGNKITPEKLEQLMPPNIDGWQRTSLKFEKNGAYDEHQAVKVQYSKVDISYDIDFRIDYDVDEDQIKRLRRIKNEVIQTINSDKTKSIQDSNKTIYGRANADLHNIAGLKVSYVVTEIHGTTFYIFRRKKEAGSYELKFMPMLINGMALMVRACDNGGPQCVVKNAVKSTDALISMIQSINLVKLASLNPQP